MHRETSGYTVGSRSVGNVKCTTAADGAQANSVSAFSSVSADGRHVAFDSCASNLVSDDSGYTQDIFVHEQLPATMFLPVVRKP